MCQELAFSCLGVSAEPSAEVNNAAELGKPAAFPPQPVGTASAVILLLCMVVRTKEEQRMNRK